MSTTTSHTSEPDRPAEGPVRSARLIQNESTTEIPVHLLFRDDPDPAPVALKPAVVSRRHGTGEQPRLRRPAVPQRTVPRGDHGLAERPERVLWGTDGVLAGLGGGAG
ncbi:SPFH domain-containing protein, partial [Streptomyces sp. NPDC055952]